MHLSARLFHRSLTSHCRHRHPPMKKMYSAHHANEDAGQHGNAALLVVHECVPQYGRKNLQVTSLGRRPVRKRISSE